MKDIIILQKAKKEKMLSESIADMTIPVEVAPISNSIDLVWRYN